MLWNPSWGILPQELAKLRLNRGTLTLTPGTRHRRYEIVSVDVFVQFADERRALAFERLLCHAPHLVLPRFDLS